VSGMANVQYPEYRDSGMEWVGAIPAHWTAGRYKFCTTRVVVGIAEAATHAYADIGVPIIRSTNIKAGAIDQNGLLFIKPEFAAQNDSKYLYANDIVTVRTGYPGVSAVVPLGLNRSQCFTNLVATPKNTFQPEFLCAFLNSHVGMKYFELLGWGSAQKNISVPILQNIPVVYPGIHEQREIMAFLDYETAKIDALIEKQQQLIELLKEKRSAILHQAISSPETKFLRLEHCWDEVYRPISRQEDETYFPIGLLNRGRGIFHKEPCLGCDLGDSEFFFVEQGDLVLSGQFAWEGAVALASENENGTVATHRYPIVRGKDGVALTEYLWAFFASPTGDMLLNESSRGAAGRNRPLNMNSLKKETVPVAPLKIQREVTRIVMQEKAMREYVQKPIDLLQERRTALISAAVTGKIDVRGWKPPASDTAAEVS